MGMGWKKFLFLPGWLLLVLTLGCAAGLGAVFLRGQEQSVLAYGIFALSFYTLCADTCWFIWAFPRRFTRWKETFLATSFGSRWASDKAFRQKFSLNISLGVNVMYVGIHLISWYVYRSWWFVVLGVYYGILSAMRLLLIPKTHGRRVQLKRALGCGYIMLLLNLFLTGAVMMMVYQNRGYSYHGILIYVMALHTFYTAIHAVTQLMRCRRFENPMLSAAKAVSVAAALVSMLNLETAMFASFGQDMAKADQNLFIMLTGAGISIAVIAMAVQLIVRCTKEIRSQKYGQFL